MSDGTSHDGYDSRVGARPVSGAWVAVLTAVFVGFSAFLVYAAMAFWPPALLAAADPTTPPPPTTTNFLGQTVTIAREQNLLLLVAVLGSLGAMAYVLRSFYMYVGQRRLRWSWVTQYVATPFVGAVLATITYILLRAGLVGGTGTQEGNIWGFASVATLVGLFNVQAAGKLKDIFEVILASSDANRDTRDRLDAAGTFDAGTGAAPALQVIATNGNGAGSHAPEVDEAAPALVSLGASDGAPATDEPGTAAAGASDPDVA